jgi:hypothetical protein
VRPPPDPDPVDLALFIDRLEFDLLPRGGDLFPREGMGRLLVLDAAFIMGVGDGFKLALRGALANGPGSRPDPLKDPLKLLPPEGGAYVPVALEFVNGPGCRPDPLKDPTLVGRGTFMTPLLPSGGKHLKHFPFVTRPGSVRGRNLKTFFLKHFRPQVTHSPLFLRMVVSSCADITEPVVLKSLPRFSIRFMLTCCLFL